MGKKRKAGRKILAGVLSGSMIFYCSSYTTVLSAKSAAVVKKGYTISKKAGKYTKSVTVKVKAKKGYTVYYTTGKNLSVKKKIKAKKTVCCIERQQRQYSSHSTAIQDIPVRSNVL